MDELALSLVKKETTPVSALSKASQIARQVATEFDVPVDVASQSVAKAIVKFLKSSPTPDSPAMKIKKDIIAGKRPTPIF